LVLFRDILDIPATVQYQGPGGNHSPFCGGGNLSIRE